MSVTSKIISKNKIYTPTASLFTGISINSLRYVFHANHIIIFLYLGSCVPGKKDLTKEAQKILNILENAKKIEERVTLNKLLDAWNGKGNKKLRVNDVPVRMSPSKPAIALVDCQRFLIHLLLDGVLNEDFHFTPFSTISYLVPGLRANNVLAGKVSVFMDLSSEVG